MEKVKFSFFLKTRANKLNQHPVVMTITLNKQRTQIFTGVWVEKKRWNKNTKQIKGHDENTRSLNDTLISLQANARQISNELLLSGKPFNPNSIKEKLKNGYSKSIGVIEGYNLFLNRMEKLIGTKYERATYVKYKNTMERVREFIKQYTKRNDISLYELDSQFMEELENWLRTKYKVSHNTIYKTYQRFTRFIRHQINIGSLDKYPFPNYKIKMVIKQGHYLTYEEIQKIENIKLDLPRLEQTRLLFLFCCYVGTSFIDMYNLTIDNLVKDENDIFWIKSFRKKSRSRVSVPLISNAIKILDELRIGKYFIQDGKLLPIKANSHLNYEIKQVCGLAGIDGAEKVCWHDARRSLSSIMMKANLPLLVLQKVLSHKTLYTSIQWYSHTDDEMVSKAMLELDIKLNSNKIN